MDTVAEIISNGWILPHDTDGGSAAEVWTAIRDHEIGPHGIRDVLDPSEVVAVVGAIAIADVEDRDGVAVVTFPDGSRLHLHGWSDGTASGWWWIGDGPNAYVSGEIGAEADARLADAAEDLRGAAEGRARSRGERAAEDLRRAARAYGAAVADVAGSGGGPGVAAWITYAVDAVAAGIGDAEDVAAA